MSTLADAFCLFAWFLNVKDLKASVYGSLRISNSPGRRGATLRM